MDKISIYLAGPLFDIADRHRNLLLAQELEALDYRVVLPQKEAIRFFDGKKFNVKAICDDCVNQSVNNDVIVANIDGPDADAGTALEVGTAYSSRKKPLIICVRTDFRTAIEKEVGYNAMFNLADSVIYRPAYVNSLEEAMEFYKELAKEIDEAITQERQKKKIVF